MITPTTGSPQRGRWLTKVAPCQYPPASFAANVGFGRANPQQKQPKLPSNDLLRPYRSGYTGARFP